MKILFVCLGNICRSPLADGLLRKKVAFEHLPVEVDSAGTSGFHSGEGPDHRMTATARNRGTDLSGLKARKFVREDFDCFDRIYVMDDQNMEDVLSLARNEADRQKVSLALSLSGSDAGVPDPYYGGQLGFDHVYDLLDEATDNLMLELRNLTL